MSLTYDYLRLYKTFAVRSGVDIAVQATSEQLALALGCSARNAKLIIRKMEARGWARYTPGRGRGNVSEIRFLLPFETTLEQEAKRLVKDGKVEEAFKMVQAYGELSSFQEETFMRWLSGYFGYSVESRRGEYVETLKLPLFRELNGSSTLDPAQSFYALDMHLIRQLYDTLVVRDAAAGRYAGALAHHWKRDDSAAEWTFYLRKGVLFHHGGELTAEDVRFSLLRLRDNGSQQRWLAEDIESVHVLNRYAVKVKLKRPNFLFLAYVSYPPMSIVPQQLAARPAVLPMQTVPASDRSPSGTVQSSAAAPSGIMPRIQLQACRIRRCQIRICPSLSCSQLRLRPVRDRIVM
ncbi:ABC transporter substrate-binding protein [Paenibacillus protaetiae]|uniref:Solute-binding protein family 5 domain-containing protein n=1 Tax=Paenibacillus protaetiae TaxID=2509456 RepID=A0A4P6ERG2_9BACL|nr:ABC transporter substrate-binding protein [Paenibacillus protaetiae]QAY65454.1 hypothetical protein ET464_02740 [Paenibacillus protaetiae]